MSIDALLTIAWQIAEVEARALGSRVIEPIHFLLAALKVADLKFPEQLDELGMPTEEWKIACWEAVKVRQYLDVIPDKICLIRRRLRHRLARSANPPVSTRTKIHRSRKTCASFFDAYMQQKSDTLTLVRLLQSMFELDFLDVSDMRWRGETQTR